MFRKCPPARRRGFAKSSDDFRVNGSDRGRRTDSVDGMATSAQARRWAKTGTTQQRILDAATEIFATRGFTAATMADVVAGSGASIGSIYHHFCRPPHRGSDAAGRRGRRPAADLRTAVRADLEAIGKTGAWPGC